MKENIVILLLCASIIILIWPNRESKPKPPTLEEPPIDWSGRKLINKDGVEVEQILGPEGIPLRDEFGHRITRPIKFNEQSNGMVLEGVIYYVDWDGPNLDQNGNPYPKGTFFP